MPNELHVILGTGPVGCWIARTLREQNFLVRAVNRSGKRPALMPADVEVIAADVSTVHQAIDAAEGARVVYQALNPPYHKWHESFQSLQDGALAAAKAAGARYVSIENLYMYDSSKPMNEDSPIAPRSKKGKLRARMAGQVIPGARASVEMMYEFTEPFVVNSNLVQRTFGLEPTPVETGIERALSWYKKHAGSP